MREIKYRAWVDGCFMSRVYGIEWDYVNHNQLIYVDFEERHSPASFKYISNDVELMQFTGLQDRNGVDIYEGDIVKGSPPRYIDEVRGVVEYGALSFAFVGKTKQEKRWFDTITTPTITVAKDIKVVGNVYENPELIEDEGDIHD